MFTVMDPPERVLPEDYAAILAAAHLVDIFSIATADTIGNHDRRIADLMTDQEQAHMEKVGEICEAMPFNTLEQQVLGQAFSIYLHDLYCLAALRIMPEEKLVRCIPRSLATPEIAKVVERYDMFTTSRLISLAME